MVASSICVSKPITNWASPWASNRSLVNVEAGAQTGDIKINLECQHNHNSFCEKCKDNHWAEKERHVREMVDATIKKKKGEHPRDFKKRKEAEVQRLLRKDFEAPAKMVEQSEKLVEKMPDGKAPSTTQTERPLLEEPIDREVLPRLFLQQQYEALCAQLDKINTEAQLQLTEIEILKSRQKMLEDKVNEADKKYQQLFKEYEKVCKQLGIEP